MGVPIRASHKLVYEVYFSVYGQTGSGAEMLKPGPGGLQVMRRNLDTVVPQVSDVSMVEDLTDSFSVRLRVRSSQPPFLYVVTSVINEPKADAIYRFDRIWGKHPSDRRILLLSH